eukprot:8715514-Pyramimonas_sp.AAC.1
MLGGVAMLVARCCPAAVAPDARMHCLAESVWREAPFHISSTTVLCAAPHWQHSTVLFTAAMRAFRAAMP